MTHFKDSSVIANSQPVSRLRLESCFSLMRVVTHAYVMEVRFLNFIPEIISQRLSVVFLCLFKQIVE
jgi:hypothetical protein